MNVIINEAISNTIKLMNEMRPLEVGRVISNCKYSGDIVMRTASISKFEVINLTLARVGECWIQKDNDTTIEILENVTLTVDIN